MAKPIPLATLEQLAARVNEPIEDEADIALAEILLETVSADVRSWGDAWPDRYLAPPAIKAIVIRAAARGYHNVAGYTMERGDMLTLQRSDMFANGEVLTDQEILQIQRHARGGSGSIVSVPIERDAQVSDRSVFADAAGDGGGGNASF